MGRAVVERHGAGDLLAWLDGHPLGLRLLPPQLGPAALLAGLKGRIKDVPPGFVDLLQGRLAVLGASLGSAFSRIGDGHRPSCQRSPCSRPSSMRRC